MPNITQSFREGLRISALGLKDSKCHPLELIRVKGWKQKELQPSLFFSYPSQCREAQAGLTLLQLLPHSFTPNC